MVVVVEVMVVVVVGERVIKNTHGKKKDLLNKSIIVLFQNLPECFLFAAFLTFLTFSSHALIPSSKTGRGPRRPS